jgi:hypothetical protein
MSEAGSIADYVVRPASGREKNDETPDSRNFLQRILDDVCGETWERSMIAAVRFADRAAGPRALPFILLPWIAVDLMRRWYDYNQFCRLRSSLPESFWRGTGLLRHYLRMIAHWQKSMAMCVLADRAHEPRWQRRIKVYGAPPDELKEWGERPVILACLHTGAFAFLRHWLRARRMSVAALLKTRPRIIRRYEEQREHERGDSKQLQNFIDVTNLRTAVRFLTPGRILIVAIEAQPGSRAQTIMMGAPLRVGDGAPRLARLTGATLLPVSLWVTSGVDIRFGTPVPREIIDSGDIQAANDFLARELWNDLARDPCAIGWTTLEAYAPENLLRPRTRWP